MQKVSPASQHVDFLNDSPSGKRSQRAGRGPQTLTEPERNQNGTEPLMYPQPNSGTKSPNRLQQIRTVQISAAGEKTKVRGETRLSPELSANQRAAQSASRPIREQEGGGRIWSGSGGKN